MPRRLYSAGSLISSRRVVVSTKNMSYCAPLTIPPSQGRRGMASEYYVQAPHMIRTWLISLHVPTEAMAY